MRVCVRGPSQVREERVWPRGGEGSGVDPPHPPTPQFDRVTLGCRNEQPHGWARANHKQYTALQDSGDTLLEMVNPSDRDLR